MFGLDKNVMWYNDVYLVPNKCAFFGFVINSNIIHEKCKILRSNIPIFRVMGPRNLMNGYKGFPSGYTTFVIQKAVKIDPDSPSRTFITLYQTIGCPNPDCITNPHHCVHRKTCTNCTTEVQMEMSHCETEIQNEQYAFRDILFLPILNNLFHILSLIATCLTKWRRNTGWFQQTLNSPLIFFSLPSTWY
jgi:hypothetical protein